jgi:hypothetical protein
LAGAPSFSAAVSTTYVFKATMRGSEIRLWINGILYNIWTETTTSATGKVGISFQGSTAATSTTGVHIDRLDADVAPALSTSALICTFDTAADGSSLFNYTSESGHHWDRHVLFSPTNATAPTIQGGGLAKGSAFRTAPRFAAERSFPAQRPRSGARRTTARLTLSARPVRPSPSISPCLRLVRRGG